MGNECWNSDTLSNSKESHAEKLSKIIFWHNFRCCIVFATLELNAPSKFTDHNEFKLKLLLGRKKYMKWIENMS
jgi:hypothetical protein